MESFEHLNISVLRPISTLLIFKATT